MTARSYTLIVFLSTIFFWISWVTVLSFVSPNTTNIGGYFLFFSTLGMALVGSIYLLTYFLHQKVFGKNTVYHSVAMATRRGILFGILIVGCLWMQSQSLLNVYNSILLVVVLTLIELFFLSRKKEIQYVERP